MDLFKYLSRVYIRIDGMYDLQQFAFGSLDLMTLINEVAKANPSGDGECLYDTTFGKVCVRRTKVFIVRRVEAYISDLYEIHSEDENMANYASLKQLNKLISAFSSERKQISCYGLVYVYVMYTLLEGKSDYAASCAAYLVALYNLVAAYFENHPEDELAGFFYGCFDPIINAVQENNTNLDKAEIPHRPRKRPKPYDN